MDTQKSVRRRREFESLPEATQREVWKINSELDRKALADQGGLTRSELAKRNTLPRSISEMTKGAKYQVWRNNSLYEIKVPIFVRTIEISGGPRHGYWITAQLLPPHKHAGEKRQYGDSDIYSFTEVYPQTNLNL